MKYSHQTKNVVDEETGAEKSVSQNSYKAVNGPLEISVTLRHDDDASPAVVNDLCKKARAFVREFEHPNQVDLLDTKRASA